MIENPNLTGRWRNYLRDCGEVLTTVKPIVTSGRLTKVTGLVMEAVGLRLAVGSCCMVYLPNGQSVEAEVVGFSDDRLYLMRPTTCTDSRPARR